MSTYAGDEKACDSEMPKGIGGGVNATAAPPSDGTASGLPPRVPNGRPASEPEPETAGASLQQSQSVSTLVTAAAPATDALTKTKTAPA